MKRQGLIALPELLSLKVLNNRQQLNHPYHHAVQLNCVIMLRVNLIGGVGMVFYHPRGRTAAYSSDLGGEGRGTLHCARSE